MAIVTKSSYRGQDDTSGLTGGLRFETDNNRIIGRDINKIPRIIILSDKEDFLVKISKPGFDVLTATDDELIFNSNQNIFKIVDTGTISVTKSSAQLASEVSVSHGLGYIPAYLGYVFSTGYFLTPLVIFDIPTSGRVTYDMFTDANNVYARIVAQNTGAIESATFKYFLMQETAN